MRWNRQALLVTGVISGLGALGGAVAGVVLPPLISRIVGAFPPTPEVYVRNITIMAGFGAVFGPVLAWSMMRFVPLWRSVLEPAIAAIAASIVSALVAPSLFAVLVPGAVILAAWRLNRAHRGQPELVKGSGR